MTKIYPIIILFLISFSNIFSQFGMNRVNYKDFEWFFIQTEHFDIYFAGEGSSIAEFAAKAAEDALADLQQRLSYRINNRISLIVYNSHNDFQETNTTDSYLSKGTGGFTEPFKNRVVFPFEGSYTKFRHVIHHELVHAVMRDMFYGGTVQNIIAKGITLQLPHWVWEGTAEYYSSAWETNSDQFIRNAIINEFLPDIERLSGYFGYRGGQSVFYYISQKYGDEKIGEIISKTRGTSSFEEGLKASIGLTIEELNERWKKDLKVEFWPEIASRREPDDFAERITDNKKSIGFYNTSPAISPMGDKVAFISDRDIYLDVYVVDLKNKEKVVKVVKSGVTNDFEELNILFPSLTWAPDNKRIALSVKRNGYNVISVIDTETKESSVMPFKLDGIESVSWSPDGKKIAFNGADSKQSDIYVYDIEKNELKNITNDIFSDFDPAWDPKSERIFFSSDRGKYINRDSIPSDFDIYEHNYHQLDLYFVEIESGLITRITELPFSDERSPVVSADGKKVIFSSDKNGINNLYKKSLAPSENNSFKSISDQKEIPLTNSLNEINQLSISSDGKKLVFTTLYKQGYNIFLINNPFELQLDVEELEYTPFMASLVKQDSMVEKENIILSNSKTDSIINSKSVESFEKEKETNEGKKNIIFTGQLIEGEPDEDTSKIDYSKYIFSVRNLNIDTNSTVARDEDLFQPNLDRNGNYLLNPYKINFSPDLIYANAGWSSLYGLLGTTVLSFSDMLGNHRLIGITSLQIDLKNSDYGLAYYYLGNRLNYGIEGFHTARFIYITRGFGYSLYRFRNYGGVLSASYPLNRFYRFDFGLSAMSISSENLDDLNEPMENATYFIPSASFVHDNTMWGYYSPIQGTRYNFTVFGNPGFDKPSRSFFSLNYDVRNYLRFWFDNSFVFRFSGGYSGGANPQRFFLGGTDNWINRTFATGEIPVSSAEDFAFLSPALPMRGYNYAEKIGSKYSLINLELRMPLIRYLLTGPIPLFFQNILGTAFIDIGTAWDDNKQLQLFGKDQFGNRITKDLLIGTGFGVRSYFLFFLLRFDVAWAYNIDSYSKPKYYFSIGTDF